MAALSFIFTSGVLRNDLLTPAVRFIPCMTPLLGPSAPMESSDTCLGFTTPDPMAIAMTTYRKSSTQVQTCSDQSELVLFIPDLLLLHVSPREEKSHHSLEELVHELNGERHHISCCKAAYASYICKCSNLLEAHHLYLYHH
uniref:Uncharacterized protein n=1 Tax=Electrophorus electricus TaxID=8005 RepID=A0AAY5EG13_ELEEL